MMKKRKRISKENNIDYKNLINEEEEVPLKA